MRRSLLVVPLCLVVLAGCSAAPAASRSQGGTAPTATPSLTLASPGPSKLPGQAPDVGMVFTGILSMDDIEGGCAFLQAADGRRLQVIYPDGWQLNKSPLELLAPDGTVHSRAGDRVTIRGAESGEMASICQIGPIIRALEVLGP